MIESQEYRGYTIEVHLDHDPSNPCKEWDLACKMVCWHRSYDLGHEQVRPYEDYIEATLVELAQAIHPNLPDDVGMHHVNAILAKHYVMEELYLYDHSGITMRCYPFACRWDSGQVGFAYISITKAREEWGAELSDHDLRAKARECIRAEVKTYSQYLEGDVYEYIVSDPDGKEIDSCCGFYGWEEAKWHDTDHSKRGYMMQQAVDAIDYHIKTLQEASTQAMQGIVNSVTWTCSNPSWAK